MVREALKVLLLLLKLLLELLELLPLALTNSHVLAGAFTALEGVAVSGKFRSVIDIALASTDDRAPGLSMIVFCTPENTSHRPLFGGGNATHPWPPVLGGAPVSPAAMARAVVVKAARRGRKAAVLMKVVRSMLGNWQCLVWWESGKRGRIM